MASPVPARRHEPAPVLEIRGSGAAFFVISGGRRVGGPYSNHGNAVAALAGIERRLRPEAVSYRCCPNCKTGFLAAGRASWCPDCRGKSRHSPRRVAR